MIKIIISGCNGHMGHVVASLCNQDNSVEVVAGFDILGQSDCSFPVFTNPSLCTISGDVIIDFSSPVALDSLLAYGIRTHTPLVLATTGYNKEQIDKIHEASQVLPVFQSANMSLGINILLALVKQAAATLGDDFDVEIVERHHRRKLDTPSGTALMLADAASSALPYDANYIYERQSIRSPRTKQEIGISSLRGGTIVGDHSVIFAGRDEVIELSHHAASREIFATGALRAAIFMASISQPGLYSMDDLLQNIS